jgi:nucleoside-diphosphate-sugar epimerase
VRSLVRYRSDLAGEYQFDLANNILDPAALQPPVRAVVHCAWDIKADSMAESRRINVEGTKWLVEQCRKAKVGHFVFVSSLAAGGGSVYARTKMEMEKKLLANLDSGQLTTVIAPGLVVGNGGVFALARSAVKHRGVTPIFCGFGQKKLPTVFIDDLCDVVMASINNRVSGRLSVADESGVSTSDLYRGLGLLERKKLSLLPVPGPGLLGAPASINLLGGKLSPADIAETNRLLGGKPVMNYWQSLEKLAVAEGAEDVAKEIREYSGARG